MKYTNTDLVLATLFLSAMLAIADPGGTAFTWQGRLSDSGQPAAGVYDLQFIIYDSETNGVALGTNALPAAAVSNGLYTAALDFGAAVFDGNARWLELCIRTNGAPEFTTLAPRQALTPTPYALRAQTAGLLSGVLSDAQLSPNIPRLDATNTFTGSVTLGGAVTVSGSNQVANLNAQFLNGKSGADFVAKAGDTMTGTLNLANGELLLDGKRALSTGYFGMNGLTINLYNDWPLTTIQSPLGVGNFAGANTPKTTLHVADYNPELRIEQWQHVPGSATLKLMAAGNNTNKAQILLHNLTLESASGGGGDYLRIHNDSKDLAYFGNNGNVGIGTTSPSGRLHIASDPSGAELVVGDTWMPIAADSQTRAYFGNSATSTLIKVGQDGYNYGQLSWNYDPLGANGYFDISSSRSGLPGPLVLSQDGGNVGIGTTTPDRTLHVQGNGIRITGANPALSLGAAGGSDFGMIGVATLDGGVFSGARPKDTGVAAVSTGNLLLGIGYTERMRISNNGNVGIGTTSPSAKLEVAGSVKVTGSGNSISTPVLSITGGSDVAEPFAMSGGALPAGSVVVIDPSQPGHLKLSAQVYDKRVAGVVSGAGGVQPGLTLSQAGLLESGQNVALTGRVYVQAEATATPIEPGDLLTTSALPGHAMKATDPVRAQGAILGKAMTTLESGQGLVLVLVTLQ